MRRIINFLGVILVGALVFALAPSTNAMAGKGKPANNGNCGGGGNTPTDPNCDCMPLSTFTANGNAQDGAVDDINAIGCYESPVTDPLLPNPGNPLMACPVNSNVNFACGCILAGGDNPSGQNVLLIGDAQHGNWTLTNLQISYAYGNNNTPDDFFIGNPNGTAAGTNGGRCYGASGFATLVSVGNGTGLTDANQVAYFELQGSVCDTIPLIDDGEPQKGTFTGSFILDPTKSSSLFAGWNATGQFVISIDNTSAVPAVYSDSSFSFSGYMTP